MGIPFSPLPFRFHVRRYSDQMEKSGQTQFEFVALLLFDGSPLLLTLRKLLELFGFAERSHQLLPIYGCHLSTLRRASIER